MEFNFQPPRLNRGVDRENGSWPKWESTPRLVLRMIILNIGRKFSTECHLSMESLRTSLLSTPHPPAHCSARNASNEGRRSRREIETARKRFGACARIRVTRTNGFTPTSGAAEKR